MAVLEKIRVKFGVFATILIAVGLLSFIVDPQSVISALHNLSSSNDVGEINGKVITYPNFLEDVQKTTEINELMTGRAAQGAARQAQIRNQTWNDLIFKFLFIDQANDAGIFVSKKEIENAVTGPVKSPFVAQNPLFMDRQSGRFSDQRLAEFLRQTKSNPRLRLYWDYLLTSIKNQSYFNKYRALFASSFVQSPTLLAQDIQDNNTSSDISYVAIPYSGKHDSSIVITKAQIQKFYNEHKNLYKQGYSRDIKYVVFPIVPSEADFSQAMTNVRRDMAEFASTNNVKSFLLRDSDRPYVDYWYKKGDLATIAPELEQFVWTSSKGVSEIVKQGDNLYVARVMDTKSIPDSVYVRHILLSGPKAQAQADSLLKVISKGANFSNIAAQYSLDKNSAADGVKGNIGWLTQNYMIPGYQSVLTAKKNKPFIIKTQYGTDIVEVTKTTKPVERKNVAIYVKEVRPSNKTNEETYRKASILATTAKRASMSFDKAVNSLGLNSQTANKITESTHKIGSMSNAKELTNWAFEKSKNDISNVINVESKYYVVATVTGINKKGYTPIEELTPYIKQYLYKQAYDQKMADNIAKQIKGLSLDEIAKKFNTSVNKEAGISFGSLISTSNLDPALIGASSVAPLNLIQKPLVGRNATYVFMVTSRKTAKFYTARDAKNKNIQYANYLSNFILPVMEKDANVVNNIGKFFE